jgi:hypothetical protein
MHHNALLYDEITYHYQVFSQTKIKRIIDNSKATSHAVQEYQTGV